MDQKETFDWMRSELDRLRTEVEALQRENAQLLNDASVWRNRAINAEEELAGTNRLRRATQPAPQELK